MGVESSGRYIMGDDAPKGSRLMVLGIRELYKVDHDYSPADFVTPRDLKAGEEVGEDELLEIMQKGGRNL